MFTGIIEEIGTITTVEDVGDEKRIRVKCGIASDGLSAGDSVAVNGACLTVEKCDGDWFWAHLSVETVSRTTFTESKPGDMANLERSLVVGGRMDGHMVLGHVDCVGSITRVDISGEGKVVWAEVPEEFALYVAPKGSISVDGVSLTTVDVTGKSFSVALVPFTLEKTTLGIRRPGDKVNIEVDVIAKYLRRFLEVDDSSEGITMEKLLEGGFA